jgi:hypothetical protein
MPSSRRWFSSIVPLALCFAVSIACGSGSTRGAAPSADASTADAHPEDGSTVEDSAAQRADSGLADSTVSDVVDSSLTDTTVVDSTTAPQDVGPPDTGVDLDSAIVGDTVVVGDTAVSGPDSGAPADSGVVVPPPSATPVATGNNLEIWGVTGDGFIVYSDETAGILYALPATLATPPQIIATSLGSNANAAAMTHTVRVLGNVVIVRTGLDSSGYGTLAVWASGAPNARTLATHVDGAVISVTSDSSYVAYIANVTYTPPSTWTADLYAAAVAGGSPTLLASGLDYAFFPSSVAAGSSYVLLFHYDGADGGAGPAIASQFNVTSGARVDIATNVNGAYQVDPSGKRLLVGTRAGLELFPLGPPPLAGGEVIDPAATGVGQVQFSPDGLSAVYSDYAVNELRRSPLASPGPVPLQPPSGMGIFNFQSFWLSPSGAEVVGEDGEQGGIPAPIFIASASMTGAATQVTYQPSAFWDGQRYSPAVWTTDSARVVYNSSTATLSAWSVAAGSSTALAPGVAASTVLATGSSSSIVVFNTNVQPSALSDGHGTADLFSVDSAATSAPTLIANQANLDVFLTPARQKVVFAWCAQPGPKSGLYVVPIP